MEDSMRVYPTAPCFQSQIGAAKSIRAGHLLTWAVLNHQLFGEAGNCEEGTEVLLMYCNLVIIY